MPDEKHRDGQRKQADGVAGAEAVGEALRRRLAGLGIADEADDAGVGAFRGRPQHLGEQGAVGVERAAEHGVAGLFFHRHRFARQRRFIRRGLPVEHPRIHRELVVGQDADGLPGHQPLGVHFALAAIRRHQRGGFWRVVKQAADLPLGARQCQALERIAQRKQKQQRPALPPGTDRRRPDRHRQHQNMDVQVEPLHPVQRVDRRIPAA